MNQNPLENQKPLEKFEGTNKILSEGTMDELEALANTLSSKIIEINDADYRGDEAKRDRELQDAHNELQLVKNRLNTPKP